MSVEPRWLLSIPDPISQLEQLERQLLTRRDIERLLGVGKVRAAALMTTFGAELVGNQKTLPRTELLQQLKKHRGRAAFRHEEERGERLASAPAVDAAAAAEATSGVAPAGSAALALPRVIVEAGPVAVGKFVEYLARRIANERTRAAYARAAGQFLGWCEARGLRLEAVSPLHVAAYIRTHPGSPPTVKQHLAAIRMFCDWLVVSQVLPVNPAAARRAGSPPGGRGSRRLRRGGRGSRSRVRRSSRALTRPGGG